MLTVNIPDQVKPIIERLAAMEEAEFEKFRTALSAAPPNLRLETFNDEVKNILSEQGADGAVALVDVIMNLSRAPRDSSVSIEELAASVTLELARRKGHSFDPALLESRLVALFGIQSIKLWARASEVQHQYENIFIQARIVSDIRTVFEADGTRPLGAMIVHNLRITTSRGRQSHDHFFALDNADLDVLQLVIQRAKDKTISLEDIIGNQSKLTYFQSK